MLIAVEAGHLPGEDPGAVGGPLPPTEAVVTGQIARALAALSGSGVIYAPKRRPPKLLGGLGRMLHEWRTRRAKFDVVISLHMDSAGETQRGLTAYYWGADPDGRRALLSHDLAQCIADCASGRIKAAPYLRRTKKGDVWFTPGILVNTASQASVLVEVDNIANPAVEAETMATTWAGRRAVMVDCGVRRWTDRG